LITESPQLAFLGVISGTVMIGHAIVALTVREIGNPVATSEIPELRRLARAKDDMGRATSRAEVAAARLEVDAAAEAARDAGIGWSEIGEALDIARGCAYQRYRRRGTGMQAIGA
jgi:hypothetical protein